MRDRQVFDYRIWDKDSNFPIYWHATPYSNFHSIVEKGLLRSWGGVYCSTERETAVKWICFTRSQEEKIMAIPFKKNPKDMELGMDHSPIMTKMLGVEDDSASFVYPKAIPANEIMWDMVVIYDNPFYAKKEEE